MTNDRRIEGKTEHEEPDGLAAIVQNYFKALDDRDLTRCLEFFAEDATIKFQSGVFKGKQAIAEWHKDRFEADLRLLKLNKIETRDDQVHVEGVVTSKRLKAWKINKLSGKATFTFENGKIMKTEFGMRIYNPLEGW